MKVTIGSIAFGRMCRHRTRCSPRPLARAVFTKSAFTVSTIDVRISRASPANPRTPITSAGSR